MSTSPLSPDDIRAAAEVHAELGPEYREAVVESFLAKIDSEIAANFRSNLRICRVYAGRTISNRSLVRTYTGPAIRPIALS